MAQDCLSHLMVSTIKALLKTTNLWYVPAGGKEEAIVDKTVKNLLVDLQIRPLQ